ncbi:MAG TPA: hypothetical protein VJ814_06965 [Gaiellaceae bacterium]|nr:hypothetical protein [Gaiellaceae bacterium]
MVGFGFGVLWMTVGLGEAIVCLLLAGLGYGAVFVAERARADSSAFRPQRRKGEADALDLPELDYELRDDAVSPLAAEAEYGWPVEKPLEKPLV